MLHPTQQVTISYLGRPQLAPVGVRRVKLQEDYGFACSCPRCVQELGCEDKVLGGRSCCWCMFYVGGCPAMAGQNLGRTRWSRTTRVCWVTHADLVRL